MNTDAQSTKIRLNLNPLPFLNTFSLSLTILILTYRVEKIHSSRDSVRNGRPLGRESHLIHKAMTLETIYGLNHSDELYYCNPYPYYFLFSSFFCSTSFPPLPFNQFMLRHSPSI